MRLAVLTTETPHHTWFVMRLAERLPIARVVVEEHAPPAPFPTFHPFEARRDEHERAAFFAGREARISDFAPVTACASVNASEIVADLAKLGPDLTVVFGTGLLRRALLEGTPGVLLNLHGGNPEEYRGLDSQLWAVYHGDFPALVTTLHFVDPELDTGDIAFQAAVPLHPGMELHELRAANTGVCVDLALAAASEFARSGNVPRRPQARKGRYYSHMPAVLKDLCVRRFARHAAKK